MGERLRVGTRVGDCVLERQLGVGGMGAVYVARHVELGVRYAVKVQHLGGAHATKRAERFRREAQALAKVDRHPGIVGIHQFGVVPGTTTAYCLLDLVEGRDLAAHLEDGTPPLEQVLAWVRQIAEALAHVHAAGIVHRDLKPANIMIRDADRRALLTDFGLAKDASENERLTVTGQMVGTVHYMAPEQVTAQRDLIGPKTDVFALGAVLYELLSGAPPFSGGNLLELTAQICNSDPERIGPARADVPPDVDLLIQRCLAKDPDGRPTAREVAAGVARLERGEELGWSRRSSSLWRFGRAVRRREPAALAWAAALGAAIVAAAGSAAYYVAVARPAAAARAERERYSAWRDAQLRPWALGLGAGRAPARAELEAWIARIAPGGEARVELAELRAAARRLDHLDGREVALAERPGPDRVVDALILLERGHPERALAALAKESDESLEVRLARQAVVARHDPLAFFARLGDASGAERAAGEAQAKAAAEALWRHSCAASAAGRDVGAQLTLLGRLAQRPGLDAAFLQRVKREALEESAGAWAAQLAVPGAEVRVLRRLAGLVQVPPRGQVGPQLLAACEGLLQRLSAACDMTPHASRSMPPEVRRLLTCERLIHFGIQPGRRLVKIIRHFLEQRAFDQVSHGETDAELFLTAIRYGVSHEARDLAKRMNPERLRALSQAHPEDPGVEVLAVSRLLSRTRSALTADLKKLRRAVTSVERLLSRDDLAASVADKYVAELSLRLANRMWVLGRRSAGEAAAWAQRSLPHLARYQAYAIANPPSGNDDLLDSYRILAWARSRLATEHDTRTGAEVWERAIPVFRRRLDDPAARQGRSPIARYELGVVCQRAAESWLAAGYPEKALGFLAQARTALGASTYRPGMLSFLDALEARIKARQQRGRRRPRSD